MCHSYENKLICIYFCWALGPLTLKHPHLCWIQCAHVAAVVSFKHHVIFRHKMCRKDLWDLWIRYSKACDVNQTKTVHTGLCCMCCFFFLRFEVTCWPGGFKIYVSINLVCDCFEVFLLFYSSGLILKPPAMFDVQWPMSTPERCS